MTSDEDLKRLDEVYAERNAVVLAFATAVAMMGGTVGTITDPTEPDWPVLVINTGYGQVTWHFKADELPASMPAYEGSWDGHDTPEKYERLRRLVESNWTELP